MQAVSDNALVTPAVETANTLAVAATTSAAATAAITTLAANAPVCTPATDPQRLPGFRGDAPSLTCGPECAADGMSTAVQEMTGGLSWELAGCGRLSWLELARAFAIPRETCQRSY